MGSEERRLILEMLLLIFQHIRESNEDIDERNKKLMQDIKEEVAHWD